MNKLKSFFKLIRWPNIIMIILAQLLLQYMLISHVFKLIQMESPLGDFHFILLMMSTVLMAAFGYVYNDVQDIGVDKINKNDNRIIDVIISKKSGKLIYMSFLVFSLMLALYLSMILQMIQLIFIHLIIAGGLYFYSKQFQRKVLSGNILISLFTAMSIFIVWIYHLVVLTNNPVMMIDARRIIPFLNTTVTAYAAFAFLLSLMREIIKDIEDIKGDSEKELQTFAVVYGIKKSKLLVSFLSIIMLVLISLAAYYSYTHSWFKLSSYFIIAVVFPLLYFFYYLQKAEKKDDFKELSTLAKIIMVAGILSMQIFYINY